MFTDSSDEEKAPVVTGRVSWNSESEDDALLATSLLSVDVAEGSSSKKRRVRNRRKQKSISFDLLRNICFFTFFCLFCVNFYLGCQVFHI